MTKPTSAAKFTLKQNSRKDPVRLPSDFPNLNNRHADPSLLPSWPTLPTSSPISSTPLVPAELYKEYIYVEVENTTPTVTLKTKYTITYTFVNINKTTTDIPTQNEEITITDLYDTLEEALCARKNLELSAAVSKESYKNISWIEKEEIKYETLETHWELVKKEQKENNTESNTENNTEKEV